MFLPEWRKLAEVTNAVVKLQQWQQIWNPKSGTKPVTVLCEKLIAQCSTPMFRQSRTNSASLVHNVNWQRTWEKAQQYHPPFLQLYKWVSHFLAVHITYNPNSFALLTLLFLFASEEWIVCLLFEFLFTHTLLATSFGKDLSCNPTPNRCLFLAYPANSVPESRW